MPTQSEGRSASYWYQTQCHCSWRYLRWINDHNANVSTDQDYSHPKLRSTCSVENQEFVSEWTVFQMLDQLRPTSIGLDCLPAWFLKLGAPVFCTPIAYVFNFSITVCFDPQRWKTAWISPILKFLYQNLRPTTDQYLHRVSKMHQLRNGIAQNYSDRFWWYLAEIFKSI